MTKYLKVESDPNLLRNTDSQAIINSNSNEFDQFMEASRRKYNEKREIETLKSDVNTIISRAPKIRQLPTSKLDYSTSYEHRSF